MSYTHLTINERSKIACMSKLGFSTRQIANELGRYPSTISREQKRNMSKTGYHEDLAEAKYLRRRKKCKPHGKFTSELAQEIAEKIKLTWSPESIAGRLFPGVLTTKTIYRWLEKKWIPGINNSHLRFKGKRRKSKEQRGRFLIGKTIHDRPKEIESREEFGHWEADTVVSKRGISACLATFVERKTRMYLAVKTKDRTAESMKQAISEVKKKYPKAFQSITVDRGKEFACHQEIEAELGIPIYFADPYSPWQRGSNENHNGLIREFIPKSSDLSKVSDGFLLTCLEWIAHRPRKCLGWRSSYEAFLDEIS